MSTKKRTHGFGVVSKTVDPRRLDDRRANDKGGSQKA